MQSPKQSRRQADRVVFQTPRPGRFASHDVVLIDLGTGGAGVRHQAKIAPGTRGVLRFRLERIDHEIECRLGRSKLELIKASDRTLQIYRSGLTFTAFDQSAQGIREAIRKRIHRAVLRQQADAFANPGIMSRMDESSGAIPKDLLATWMEARPYIRCTLDERDRWKQERVRDTTQPENGFTVSAEEAPAEIDLLCQTYLGAPDDQRKLIRLFAELAVREPSAEPRDRYRP